MPFSIFIVYWIQWSIELTKDSKLEKSVFDGTRTKVLSTYLNQWGNLYTLKSFSLHFGTRAYLFSPDEGSCYIFSTRNNCREFLVSYATTFQSDIQPYFKTRVCGAPFSFWKGYLYNLLIILLFNYKIKLLLTLLVPISYVSIHWHFFMYRKKVAVLAFM